MPKWSAIIAVALSGCMTLMIQPMTGKLLLPSLGGGSGVWTVVSVFFQAALLAGYVYAAWLQTLAPRAQKLTHVTLLILGVIFYIMPHSEPEATPLGALIYLVLSAGIMMLVLSSTSPLIQGWLSNADPKQTIQVYRLFGISNLAAIGGLLLYPFLVERFFDLETQTVIWVAGYSTYAVAVFLLMRMKLGRRDGAILGEEWNWRWWLLPMLSTVFLLTTIARLTRDTAPVPFIWVILLSLFLLSYALVFSVSWKLGVRALFVGLMPVAVACLFILLVSPPSVGTGVVALFALSFFVICTTIHGEVVLSKPGAGKLPSFYIAMAFGGFLGGMCVLFLPAVTTIDIDVFLAVGAVAGVAANLVMGKAGGAFGRGVVAVIVGVGIAGWGSYKSIPQTPGEVVAQGRNFFGAYRIIDDNNFHTRTLYHNRTKHGKQNGKIGEGHLATTYFDERGPLGAVWNARVIRGTRGEMRVGVIGLGAGTVAAYLKTGDHCVFYEIDPDMVTVAKRHFTFCRDAEARGADIEYKVGDGRKLLESEAPNNFDIIIVDAFSGDSIPVHLLTREAIAEYSRHLAPGGVLAIHISNRILDLRRVIAGVSEELGLNLSIYIDEGGETGYASSWTFLSAEEEALRDIAEVRGAPDDPSKVAKVKWTDTFSDLVSVLK